MPDKILSKDQLKQLDGNIRKMISDGLGRSDVEAYARDFREKFGKEERPAPANLERSMRPTFPTFQEKLKERPVAATPEQQINKYDKAVIDDRSRAGKIAATIYNGLVGSLESLAGFGAELGSAYAAVPSQQQLISQIVTPEKEKVKTIGETVAERQTTRKIAKEGVKETFGKVKSGYVTKQEEQEIQGKFDLTNGLGMDDLEGLVAMSGRMIGDIGLAVPTMGSTYFMQGYSDYADEYDESAKKLGIEPNENARTFYGVAGGTVMGLMEKLAIDKLVGAGPAFKNIQKSVLTNVLKQTSKMPASQALKAIPTIAENEIKKLTTGFTKGGLQKIGFRAGVESGTEAAQTAAMEGAKIATNYVQNQEVFDSEEIKNNLFKNIINSGAAGAVYGPIIGYGLSKTFGQNVNKQVLDDIANAKTEQDFNNIYAELEDTFNRNNFNEAEREMVMQNARRYANIKQTIPESATPEATKNIIELIDRREGLDVAIQEQQETLQSKDEAVRPDIELQIATLTNARDMINDEIREQSTGETYNYYEEAGKFYKKIGESDPIEISKSRYELQNAKNYATTESEKQVQEGGTGSDIGQRQGTQERVTQKAPIETNLGDSNLDGEEISVKSLIGRRVTYQGVTGTLFQEGQTLSIETPTQIREVGNIDEMSKVTPESMGIETDESIVEPTETGFMVGQDELFNANENPQAAISRDQNGKVMNVVLTTKGGRRRKFRGAVAEDLAYQITLKQISNEPEFTTFLEQNADTINAGQVQEPAQEATARVDEQVPAGQAEPTAQPAEEFLAPIPDARPTYGRITAYSDDSRPVKGRLAKKLVADAKRVLNSIKNLGDFSVNVHDQNSFEQAVLEAGGSREDAVSRGFYLASNGEIHVNIDNASPDTVLHEGFHPILDFMAQRNPQVVNDLFNELSAIPEAAGIIEMVNEQYDGEMTQKKEAITNFVAGVANGDIVVNPSNFAKIRRFIANLLKKLGLPIEPKVLLDVNNPTKLVELSKFISEVFETGDIIVGGQLEQLSNAVLSPEPGGGADVDIDIPTTGSGRNIQFSKNTLSEARRNLKSPEQLAGTKISRTVFYDLTKAGKLDIKNIINGYTPDVNGKGGPFYSYMQESVDNNAVLAFTSINQAIQSLNRQLMFPDAVHAVASQNPLTAHLGNLSTYAALFDKDQGIFQRSVKNRTQERELLGAMLGEIDAMSKRPDEVGVAVRSILNSVSLSKIKTINDFADNIMMGAGDSFGSRNLILSEMLQEKQTKVTKSTRDSHKILHYKYGIPTLRDMAEGNNQPELASAELGDVIKLVKPSTDLVVFTSDPAMFEQYKKSPTPAMKQAGVSIELLPEGFAHESYPFVLKGENVALLDNFIGATQMYEQFKDLPKKKSFFNVGRMKKDAPAGEIKQGVKKEETGPQFQRINRDIINGFYSPIQKRVNEFKQPKASVQKWKEIVGTKTDEAVFSGLADWLGGMKPDRQLTKEEVNNFMSDNRIEINEVEKTDNTKYSEYQLPGGENYKEVLITLPQKYEYPSSDFTVQRRRDTTGNKDNYRVSDETEDYFVVEGPRGSRMPVYKDYYTKTKDDAINNAVERNLEFSSEDEWDFIDKDGKYFHTEFQPTKEDAISNYMNRNKVEVGGFKSSHFNEPNIITHLRMNTRTDVDGNKVLFLEEVQSDWGQKGKKEGFRVKIEQPNNYNDLVVGDDIKGWGKIQSIKEVNGEMVYDVGGVEITKNDFDFTTVKERTSEFKVPSAPYVTNTNAWVKLGLKVALKEAIRQGADSIAWTTGQQQNERYDLSKTIEKVEAYPAGYTERGGMGDITSFRVVTKYKSGGSDEGFYDVKELPNVLGKDLADKIIADKGGEYSGLDLAVGGKGMKDFYGDTQNVGIVGKVAKALVKELTGKEGSIVKSEIELKVDKNSEALNRLRRLLYKYEQKQNEVKNARDYNEYQKLIDETELNIQELEKGKLIGQPAIEITPELVESVKDGLPQFQKATPTKETRKGVRLFEKEKVVTIGGKKITRLSKEVIISPKAVARLNNLFTSSGVLGDKIRTFKEKMGGELTAEMNIAKRLTEESLDLLKKYKGVASTEDVDNYLTGKASINQLPLDLSSKLGEMRVHIDKLTSRLIDLGVISSEESKQLYESNKGKYMLRSYELFSKAGDSPITVDNVVKRLENVDQSKLDAALSRLEKEIKNADPSLSADEVKKKAIAQANSVLSYEEMEFGGRGMDGSVNTGALVRRNQYLEDMPELRALMGEYTDPIYKYYSSIFKLANITSHRAYLNSLKAEGMGKFLFTEKTGDAVTPVAGPDSKALAPLNGLYTFPEIYEALKTVEREKANPIEMLAGHIRMFKTVYNPPTHIKNIAGNIIFLVQNGHWNSVGKTFSYVKKANRDKLIDLIDILNREGVLNNNIGVKEINQYFDKHANIEALLSQMRNNAQDETMVGKAKKLGKKIKANLNVIPNSFKKYYGLEDDIFKIIAFVSEANLYSNAIYQKDYDALTGPEIDVIKEKAAENVKRFYPTFSRVPKFVKKLSKAMFIGDFLSFPVEAIRVSYNTLESAVRESRDSNPRIRAIGRNRLAGTMLAHFMASGLAGYLILGNGDEDKTDDGAGGLFGFFFDSEKQKENRKYAAEYKRPWNKYTEVINHKASDGNLVYTDVGSMSPHSFSYATWNAFWNNMGDKQGFVKSISETIATSMTPFMEFNMTLKMLINIYNNEDEFGQNIYNPELAKSAGDKTPYIAEYVGKQISPGMINSIFKAYRYGKEGDDQKVISEAMSQIARTYNIDIKKQFTGFIYSEAYKDGTKDVGYRQRLETAKSIYTKVKNSKSASSEEKEEAYKSAIKAYKEVLKDVRVKYEAAIRYGVKANELNQILYKANLGQKRADVEASSIISNYYDKPDQMYIRR